MSEWRAGSVIRNRRIKLGLTLEDVGKRLGVSKAFLSYVESGRRPLTPEHCDSLAELIGIPADLLLLGSGKLPRDIRTVVESDAASVTSMLRQEYEQSAVAYPNAVNGELKRRSARREALDPKSVIPKRINVSRTTPSSRAHSYHTKVPPDAIRPFVRYLTPKDAVILDPFCGSGMTGIAARLEGRDAILADLSPAAVHISRNYNLPRNTQDIRAAFAAVREHTLQTMRWLYSPAGEPGTTIEYVTWSDVFQCPSCGADIVYWDVVTRSKGNASKSFPCHSCGALARKGDLTWIREVPVETHISEKGRRLRSRPVSDDDVALISEIDAAPIPYWTPDVPFGPDWEMWRASHAAMGVSNVASFFTRRNLHALAALRHAILACTTGATRESLLFAYTACVNRASKRYQWNAKRPTNVMTGTLYISSLRYEWNVWSLFSRKVADALRYFESVRELPSTNVDVLQRSATDLGCLPDECVSMVFMDPPFGSNIFYADSSILWEAWLGSMTEKSAEIVVNRSRARIGGGKTLDDYGDLMGRAFSEAARVLVKGGYLVLAFSNTNDEVWIRIQEAIAAAGLKTASVHILDKGQPSIKGVSGQKGKERVTCLDMLITLKNLKRPFRLIEAARETIRKITRDAICEALDLGGGRTDEIYSAVVREVLLRNFALKGVTMPFVSATCTEQGATFHEGKWQWPKDAA